MDAIIIKSVKDDIIFDNVSCIIDKRAGLPGSDESVKLQLNIVWNGKMLETMLLHASRQQARNWYNNNHPSDATSGDGKRIMSEAECARRIEFIKSIEGKPFVVEAVADGRRQAKSKDDIADLVTLAQTGTAEQAEFARNRLDELRNKINEALAGAKTVSKAGIMVNVVK